ncbi:MULTISPECIES: helix-turn-helix domain-containing protein [unclassified Actinomyces]|uniref:helix-turn-helix domain-containing protein n=1 Tax=unclassified Actinomyces TaxID=2609248 RepID=UPI000D58E839|nr:MULTISPECIES: helix-turn-helix transcriptional regulator [unclassified Actinomyces]RAX21217.1 XRE family transcriptional regulator [Actinomyces sp. Z3]
MKNSVGRNIARLRLSRGMTQEQLAQRMGVTPQAVSKWENDLNYPDVATLPALAALLGTSVDALLTVPDSDAATADRPTPSPASPSSAPSPLSAPSAPSPLSTPSAPSPLSSPSAPSPAAPASTNFELIRPEPAPEQPRARRAAGRSLHIEVRGPQDNVDLAFPMQAVSALTGLIATVPQVRSAVGARGIDLDAMLKTSFNALDSTGPATLIDVTDDEDHVRIWVD